MQTAEMYIKEKISSDGKVYAEPWVILKKSDFKIIKKLKFKDYEKRYEKLYPLRNRMLLELLNIAHHVAVPKEKPDDHTSVWAGKISRKKSKRKMIEIKVTGLDNKKTFQPDHNHNIFHFYFKLSESPPDRWIRIFIENMKKQNANAGEHKRYIWIEDQYIAIRCPLKELRVAYLKEIRNILKDTNKIYQKRLNILMMEGRENNIDTKSMDIIAEHMFGAKMPVD